MRNIKLIFSLVLTLAAIQANAQKPVQKPVLHQQYKIQIPSYVPPQQQLRQPHIQVVFALDATGSMSGLIRTAKEKIWSIAGSLAQTESSPKIEIGLLFYRDKGDAFVTKMVRMQEDLDNVYEKLMDIKADGGGDEPESVNAALYESVNNFSWSQNSNTYKTIFLVGDCPPHLDYREIQYPAICNQAIQKDITINTILMGNNSSAEKIWRNIANRTQGSFTKVGMNANDLQIPTPYDQQISDLSEQIDELRYTYGNENERIRYEEKKSMSRKISSGATISSKAQRAEYNVSAAGKTGYKGSKELLDDVADKKIKLTDLDEKELPKDFKNLKGAALEKAVQQKIAQRDSLNKTLNTLSKKRQTFIEAELNKKEKGEVENSFNYKVYESVKSQAAKKNIKMKGKAKF